MPVSYQPLASSSFLDFTGYRITNATTVAVRRPLSGPRLACS
jgi:hypothetical protein